MGRFLWSLRRDHKSRQQGTSEIQGHHRYFNPREFSLRLFGEAPLTELPPPGLVAAEEEEGATNPSEPYGNRVRELLA